MAGLDFKMRGYGGVKASTAPSWGAAASYQAPVTPTQAAFGPGVSTPTPSATDILCPNDGFGVAVWVGVACIGALVFIRYSLPK